MKRKALKTGAMLIIALATIDVNGETNESCKILLSNDDGIESPGLRALHDRLDDICEVVVVAPKANQSGASHSAGNVMQGVRIAKIDGWGRSKVYSATATPAVAVSVGILALDEGMPFDLVVSGMNYGDNAGLTSLYSGTVGAATEGTAHGIPAVAVSQSTDETTDIEFGATAATEIIERLMGVEPRADIVYSINLPARGPSKGIQFTKAMSTMAVTADFVEDVPQRTESSRLFRLSFSPLNGPVEGDVMYVRDGWITVTPLSLDRSDRAELERLTTFLQPVGGK